MKNNPWRKSPRSGTTGSLHGANSMPKHRSANLADDDKIVPADTEHGGDAEVIDAEVVDVDFLGSAPRPPGRGILSTEEAAELAGEVAGLADAELPLAPGLLAMAEELPKRRLRRLLRWMAARLEEGRSLEEILEALGNRFPAHLRGLILAGQRNGRLAHVLREYVAIQGRQIELRRRVWSTLAYPCLAGTFFLGLCLLFGLYVVPMMGHVFDEFEMELPWLSLMLFWGGDRGSVLLITPPVVAVAAALFVLIGPLVPGLRKAAYWIPYLGSTRRWRELAEFSRLMEILLDQRTPLPEALKLAAAGAGAAHLSAACRQSAQWVARGGALVDCVDRHWSFPPSLRPFLQQAARGASLARSFGAAAEMFERRITSYATMWEVILPPILLALIGLLVGFVILGVFLPMLGLMESLTG